MKKDIKNLSQLLKEYLLNEAGGLAKIADDAVIAAKAIGSNNWDSFANLSKTLAKYGDDAADLQYALGKAGKSIDVESVLRSIKSATETPGDTGKLSSAIAKARRLEREIVEAEGTADFAKNVSRGTGTGTGAAGGTSAASGAAGAAGTAGGAAKSLTRADFVTQEGFELYNRIQRLERMGANEAQLAAERAKMLKAEGLDDIVDANQSFLKRMKELDEEIVAKRTAGAISEAERLERLKLKLAGGTTYERLKMWIKQNPAKAILLGLSAGYLGYLGFTYSPKGVVPGPTPKPGPSPTPGPGGGTKWKKCEDTEMKKGCAGSNVRSLQSSLDNMGYSLNVDGKFGPKTEAMLRKFQKENGLSATGKVDQATLDKIEEVGTGRAKTTDQTQVPNKTKEEPKVVDVPATEKDKEEFDKSKQEFEKAQKEREELRKQYVAKESLIRQRNEQVEKLVFERLVKGCK